MDEYGGRLNDLRGAFGEAWLAVVASGHKYLHAKTNLDHEKADLEIVYVGELSGLLNPAVKVQVKATSQSILDEKTDELVFRLDVASYEFMRQTHHHLGRVLVVIQLEDKEDWVEVSSDGTRLKGVARWVNLRGLPQQDTKSTVPIRIPADNTLDESGLRRMFEEAGGQTSDVVPQVDPWRSEP